MIRFLVPVVILIAIGIAVSSQLSSMGGSMAEKTIRDGIASQIRYHQSTVKDEAACVAFRDRMGVVSVTKTDEALAQLLTLSQEARSAGCLK